MYDITIETDKDSTSGDIVNEVTRVFGSLWNEIDFKLLVMVRFYSILHDHCHFYTIGGVNSFVYGLCVALWDGGSTSWVGYAYVGGDQSIYNDAKVISVQMQMHGKSKQKELTTIELKVLRKYSTKCLLQRLVITFL